LKVSSPAGALKQTALCPKQLVGASLPLPSPQSPASKGKAMDDKGAQDQSKSKYMAKVPGARTNQTTKDWYLLDKRHASTCRTQTEMTGTSLSPGHVKMKAQLPFMNGHHI